MIRKATISDLEACYACILDAKAFLKESGSTQWNDPDDDYPNKITILNDIKNGNCYVYDDNNEIHGMCVYMIGEDENYKKINGSWKSSQLPYLTIHRIAVRCAMHGKGVSKALIDFGITMMVKLNLASIKVDTHILNIPMQKLLEHKGFKHCGEITLLRVDFDNKREAYEYVNPAFLVK